MCVDFLRAFGDSRREFALATFATIARLVAFFLKNATRNRYKIIKGFRVFRRRCSLPGRRRIFRTGVGARDMVFSLLRANRQGGFRPMSQRGVRRIEFVRNTTLSGHRRGFIWPFVGRVRRGDIEPVPISLNFPNATFVGKGHSIPFHINHCCGATPSARGAFGGWPIIQRATASTRFRTSLRIAEAH